MISKPIKVLQVLSDFKKGGIQAEAIADNCKSCANAVRLIIPGLF